MRTVTSNSGEVTTYTYEANGRLGLVGYPNSTVVSYTYDTLDRMTSIEHTV